MCSSDLFAAWAVAGLYGSLGPALVHRLGANTGPAVGGGALFLLAVSGAAASYVRRNHNPTAQLVHGSITLAIGAVVFIAAVQAGSFWALMLATFVAGVGFGMGLQGAIKSVALLGQPHERPGLLSAVYVVSYLGMGAPAVVAGWLVSRGHQLTTVATGYASVLIVLALVAAAATVRARRVPVAAC